MKLTKNHRRIIFIIIVFIIVRIPSMLSPKQVDLSSNFTEGILKGLITYCEFENFPLSSFWIEHVYPPGIYLYLIIHFFFKNIFLLLLELVSAYLIYKIISRYYGKDSALNALILISFFPISIMNTGFTIDPVQLSLIFILLGFLLFFNEKPILSSISLAIGTLILYIPAIILIPIMFYYIKNEKYGPFEIFRYLGVFILVILLGSLPFLIMCPSNYISYIFQSLNEPHSENFLRGEGLIISDLLNGVLFEIEVFNILISLKLLNLIQIFTLILVSYLIFKKFQFGDERDIIISSIILFSFIIILTFYIHYRFIYWIFMLSLIIFSFNSNILYNEKKNILFGLLYTVTSSIALYISFQEGIIDTTLYLLSAFIFLFVLTICFLGLGFFYIREENLKKLMLYPSILTLCLISFQIAVQFLDFEIIDIFQYNIIVLFIIFVMIVCLLYFISHPLYNAFKKGKVISINRSESN